MRNVAKTPVILCGLLTASLKSLTRALVHWAIPCIASLLQQSLSLPANATPTNVMDGYHDRIRET